MALAHSLPNVASEEDDDDPTKVGPGSRRALKAWPEVGGLPVLYDDVDSADLELGDDDRAIPRGHTVVMAKRPMPVAQNDVVFAFPAPPAPLPTTPARRRDFGPIVAVAIGVVVGSLMPIATYFLLH